LAPLGESSGSVGLEIVSAVECALMIEMLADGGMNGGEFLHTSHAAEPLHGPFSSSKRQVRMTLLRKSADGHGSPFPRRI